MYDYGKMYGYGTTRDKLPLVLMWLAVMIIPRFYTIYGNLSLFAFVSFLLGCLFMAINDGLNEKLVEKK